MQEQNIRLNKWIAETGYSSRREADKLIEAGRVTIDGRKGVLGDQVSPGASVRVDGIELRPVRRRIYIALHKPLGIVCTADPREPGNVVDFVGHGERLFPIGRLDKDSTGLLLMTNDGDIVNPILRAANGHEKEYIVTVDKPITPEFIEKMCAGVEILGQTTLPCRITPEGPRRFRLILTQGLNRQIRRMCEAHSYNVTELKRVRIMNVHLGRLLPGHWRNLTDAEIRGLIGEDD